MLRCDAENSYLADDVLESGAMEQLLGSSITYRIAVGVGKLDGFSLHAGVAARADQRRKLEWLCRYISRPAISEKRLSLTTSDYVR